MLNAELTSGEVAVASNPPNASGTWLLDRVQLSRPKRDEILPPGPATAADLQNNKKVRYSSVARLTVNDRRILSSLATLLRTKVVFPSGE